MSYSSNGLPPRFSYSNSGLAVTQCPNPPQAEYPIYNYIEFTYIHGDNYGAVIDVSAVDGFNFPISIEVNDNLAEPLGQPLGFASSNFNRSVILEGYHAFMTNLVDEGGADYLVLAYTNNSGGLLNPTYYLDPANEEGMISPLNRVFDQALNDFFSASNASNLSITTDGIGTVPVDTYTAEYSANSVFPGTTLIHPALQFTGSITNANSFAVFNPVGFTVVNYLGESNILHYLHGQMSNTFLNFTTPLPAATPIVTNMYVTGPGADNETRVVGIVHTTNGAIKSLTLSHGTGVAAPGNFRFSKAKDVNAVSSGSMVFGCYGLFDHPQGLEGDEQKVLLALKRDIVTAFNRGVAGMAPATGAAGRTSTYWGMQTNWYPEGEAQNLFSLYMHTACVRVGTNDVPIFTRPHNALPCARGTLMGMSYGFAYDENSVHLSVTQPQVPAKHDPLPASVRKVTVTLGAWHAYSEPVSRNPANDFAGDGKSDFAVFDQNSGHWYVLGADQSTHVAWAHEWGWPGAWPVSGDFNGDGRSDYAVFDQSSGKWYVKSADQTTVIAWGLEWGWPGAWPVSGDFNGDGRSDYALFDRNTGDWYVLSADQSTVIVWGLEWGLTGAWPVSGDFNGDSRSDYALFDHNTGDWYVLSADQSTVIAWGLEWGWPGAWPVSGDFNGDGRSDYAVFDPNTGAWYVKSADQATVIAWGLGWGMASAWLPGMM